MAPMAHPSTPVTLVASKPLKQVLIYGTSTYNMQMQHCVLSSAIAYEQKRVTFAPLIMISIDW